MKRVTVFYIICLLVLTYDYSLASQVTPLEVSPINASSNLVVQDDSELSLELKPINIRVNPTEDEVAIWRQVYAVDLNDEKEVAKPQKSNLIGNILFFGWAKNFYAWVKKDSKQTISDEDERLRQQWKDNLGGHDIFHLYYKYHDARDKIKEATQIELYDFKAEADYDPISNHINLTVKKQF